MNNSQIKYPYIGKGSRSGVVFLFFREGEALVLDGGERAHSGHKKGITETLCRNITREFLENTYGEVVSPEHAKFIIYFAGTHGIANKDLWYEGSFFCFIEDVKGDLTLSFYEEDVASSSNYKKITIPLPPKAPETLSPDEETELKSRSMASELNSQPNDDEWPKVGEKVICNGVEYYYICKSPFGDEAVLSVYDSDEWDVVSVYYSELKKPKTPEDLLSEELAKKGVQDVYILACQIINGEFDSLKYVPKGGK